MEYLTKYIPHGEGGSSAQDAGENLAIYKRNLPASIVGTYPDSGNKANTAFKVFWLSYVC